METNSSSLPPSPRREWPNPTPEMLLSPEFEAVWQCIKRWDINVPDVYVGYCGATGNHVRAILDALKQSNAADAEKLIREGCFANAGEALAFVLAANVMLRTRLNDMTAAYENMRAFAQASGLNTTAEDPATNATPGGAQ